MILHKLLFSLCTFVDRGIEISALRSVQLVFEDCLQHDRQIEGPSYSLIIGAHSSVRIAKINSLDNMDIQGESPKSERTTVFKVFECSWLPPFSSIPCWLNFCTSVYI